jgi:hypothetical protein
MNESAINLINALSEKIPSISKISLSSSELIYVFHYCSNYALSLF